MLGREVNMTYKFLIIDTDYSDFLRWLYARHPRLEKQPYEEQMRVRSESPSTVDGR